MAEISGLRQSLRALGGKLGGQWERERRDTFFLLGAVLMTVLPHLFYQPFWVTAVFAILFAWRTGLVLSGRWIPRASVRIAAAVGCAMAVYAHYHTLIGREPGVTLLILFLGLKLMEVRARRDLLVVIFLCFFLLLASFFNSQSVWVAAATLVSVLFLFSSMLTMQFGEVEQPINRRFRYVGKLLLQALPIGALIFVTFPRLSQPLWGMPQEGQSARTGLSDQMSPGKISTLSESREIAFRVKFEGSAPESRDMYWRGPTFGSFDGKTWRALQRPAIPPPDPALTVDRRGNLYTYSVTLEPHGQRWIYGLEAATRIGAVGEETPRFTIDFLPVLDNPPQERVRYQATSVSRYQMGLNETPTTLRNWLELPPGHNPRTLQLATRWRGEENEDPERLVARAMELFGRENFWYTLQPPALGKNSIDDFLFGTQRGFCEHYAQALVVLLRAADVPARVVTGYQGGELNPLDEYWTVRQSDAHAWAEVWIQNKGWVRVDPTRAIAPARIEKNVRQARLIDLEDNAATKVSALTRLKFGLDAMSNAWNQWVLSYDRGKQKNLFRKFGLDIEDWHEVAMLVAVLLLLVIGVCALLTLHPKPPKDPLASVYEAYCRRLAIAGLSKQNQETGQRYLQRIERLLDPEDAALARQFTRAYYHWRYSPHRPGPEDMRHLQQLLSRFHP